ncbi:MAG TPA: hypothetical protein VFW44_02395 [Bryobacteraceae bacterium]|nr:hypothetical protein [Bryobacteraceae bacterium]
MTESQFAVMHFDVKSMVMLPGEPLLFNSLPDAESHCKGRLTADPKIGCRILDHAGRAAGTWNDISVFEQFHGQPAAKRNLLVGSVCLAIGLALILLDWHYGLKLILGVFLGIRFLWVAASKLIDGYAALNRKAQ